MTSPFSPELLREAQALLAELQAQGLKLATAESCTGGLLAGLLTEIPGASEVLERGFVTYSNAAKSSLLGVDPKLIADAGAVSSEVARAMAEGAVARAPVEIGLAVTGVAGPEGGTAAKPVGLVYIGVVRNGEPAHVREFRLGSAGRSAIRLASVRVALALAREALRR